jgi:hypothetical protein
MGRNAQPLLPGKRGSSGHVPRVPVVRGFLHEVGGSITASSIGTVPELRPRGTGKELT